MIVPADSECWEGRVKQAALEQVQAGLRGPGRSTGMQRIRSGYSDELWQSPVLASHCRYSDMFRAETQSDQSPRNAAQERKAADQFESQRRR